MSTKSRMDLILLLTHWFNGHWEDPTWGKDSLHQAVLGTMIKELASRITNADLQKQVTGAAEKIIEGGLRAH